MGMCIVQCAMCNVHCAMCMYRYRKRPLPRATILYTVYSTTHVTEIYAKVLCELPLLAPCVMTIYTMIDGHVYLCLKFKYGRIAKPEHVVFDRTLPLSEGGQMLRGIPLVVCLRGLTRSFSVVQPADHQAFPPTHPRRRVWRTAGEAARPTLLSIFSTLPGQPCINPIYPQSQVLPAALSSLLLYSLLVSLGG
jgi:hypothetical protein